MGKVGGLGILEQVEERRELKALLGTLGLGSLFSGRVKEGVCSVAGWPSGAQALAAVVLAEDKKMRGWVVVAGSVREQEEIASQIEAWGGDALVVPEAHRGKEGVRPDADLEAEWLGSLARLTLEERPRCVVVTEQVLAEKHPSPAEIQRGMFRVKKGDALDPLQFVEDLVTAGYMKVGTVAERGEVARRGGIVDLFANQAEAPLRIEWGGDRVESI
ncbi:MAG: hypothetical protein EBY81_01705, partial [Verrucomicrobia bacterium]|nr:hypothetical protein [Verrucomicrobiota bacterium]